MHVGPGLTWEPDVCSRCSRLKSSKLAAVLSQTLSNLFTRCSHVLWQYLILSSAGQSCFDRSVVTLHSRESVTLVTEQERESKMFQNSHIPDSAQSQRLHAISDIAFCYTWLSYDSKRFISLCDLFFRSYTYFGEWLGLLTKPQLKSVYLLTWSNILKIYGHKVVPVDAALFVEKSESVQDFMGCYS